MTETVVRVAEVTAERADEGEPEIPWHITPPVGDVAVQLRTTVRRIAMGAGLARKDELIAAVRALPNLPGLVTSPAGGTFVIGGPAWMGLCAIGVPPPGQPLPIDWMVRALHDWFDVALAEFGVRGTTVGKIDGAWCPGFSDIAVQGKKLIGLGFRVTKDHVVMRGVMPVQPIDDLDLALLQACHRLIDVDVTREANTSLAELGTNRALTVDQAIVTMRSAAT